MDITQIPIQNHLLAALPKAELERIAPHHSVDQQLCRLLHGAGTA